MASKREQELERELKKCKTALSLAEKKYEKEKSKRLSEHKSVNSLTKKTKTLQSRQARLIVDQEKELESKLSQALSSVLRPDIERRIEEEIKKKYPKDASSIIKVLQDMDILTS